MEPFIRLNGLVAPLDHSNIDTDAIIPKQFLKRIERSGFGQFLFYDWRNLENGQPNPDFVLNRKCYHGASILLTRENFGCGSSREHAPWSLKDFGFRVIIAPSFADIFHNNCLKNGILLITLEAHQVDQLFEKSNTIEGFKLDVDLEKCLIHDEQELSISFKIDPVHQEKLLKGLDDINSTLQEEGNIFYYEQKRPVWATPNSK